MNRPAYRPLDEGDRASFAERWLEAALAGQPPPALLLVIGLAEGDLLDALDRRAPDTRVLALEPDPAMAQAFLASGRWETWMRTGRLTYLTDPDYAGHEQAWRVVSGAATCKVLTHPASSAGAEGSVRAARTLKNIVFGARANADARRKLAPRYLVNSLRNVPAMLRGSDVRALADAYRGVPALITAAGPSLDAVIDRLPAMRDRALLIATDTTLRPLLHAGIAPQLVVGLDPSHLNARHFLSLPACGNTWLVSESALDRRATAVFGDRVFWFRAGNHQPWPFLNDLGIHARLLDVWGSVLTGAFQVACLAGCDPIVIVGADLAFTAGRPYARGTTYEFDWAWHVGRGGTLDEAWRTQIERRELHEVEDLHGARTRTTASLLSFRDWMVARAQASGRRVINAGGTGLFYGPGIEQVPLEEALPHAVDVRALSTFVRRSPGIRPSAVAARLRHVRQSLDAGSRSTQPLADWIAFSGEGFDPAAVQAALDEAAHTVETRQGAPAVASLIPWERLITRPDARGLLENLPEGLARCRSLLLPTRAVSDCPASSVPQSTRERLLIESLGLLAPIASELRRAEPLVAMVDPAGLAHIPVSTAYHLTEQVRWTIQVFEALVGRLSTALPAIGDAPFFSRAVQSQRHLALSLAGSHPAHAHASFACLHLVLQWLRCAASLGVSTDDLIARIAAMAPMLFEPMRTSSGEPGAVLSLVACDPPISIDIPLGLTDSRLARALTGAVCSEDTGELVIGRVEVGGTVVLAIVRFRPARVPTREVAPLGTLRILTDQGIPPAVPSRSIPDGVVCVATGGHHEFLLREDGSTESPILPPLADSARPSRSEWTVVIHRDADRVCLASPRGPRLSLVCYQPERADWIGQSLLVSTIDHELILFCGVAAAPDVRYSARAPQAG